MLQGFLSSTAADTATENSAHCRVCAQNPVGLAYVRHDVLPTFMAHFEVDIFYHQIYSTIVVWKDDGVSCGPAQAGVLQSAAHFDEVFFPERTEA